MILTVGDSAFSVILPMMWVNRMTSCCVVILIKIPSTKVCKNYHEQTFRMYADHVNKEKVVTFSSTCRYVEH